MSVVLFPTLPPREPTTPRPAAPIEPAGPRPHRILSLDGGGVRGMISIGFLEEIEALLRRRHNRPDMVLADYFDLIGGTSVGAILATMLALGWEMKKVRKEFEAMCPKVFARWTGIGIIRPKFSAKNLVRFLAQHIGDRTLDSSDLRTRLAIVMKRLDTGSAWVLTNNPHSRWWNDSVGERGSRIVGNRHYKLANLVRASTAAPTYFKPEEIKMADDEPPGLFVDGGLTPYNNPALLFFMMAGIKGYRADGVDGDVGLTWPLGADKLLIVSVGTGDFRTRIITRSWDRYMASLFGGRALMGLMGDCQTHSLKMLQWLSHPRRHWRINGEVGQLEKDKLFATLGLAAPMFSFARYDVSLELAADHRDRKGKPLTQKQITKLQRRLQKLDSARSVVEYSEIGSAAAAEQVGEDDFPAVFDREVSHDRLRHGPSP